jgi:hypothetical protein
MKTYPEELKKLTAGEAKLTEKMKTSPSGAGPSDAEINALKNYTEALKRGAGAITNPAKRQWLEELAKLSEQQIATKIATREKVSIPLEKVVEPGKYPITKVATEGLPKVTTPVTPRVSTPSVSPVVRSAPITEAIGVRLPTSKTLVMGRVTFPTAVTTLSPMTQAQVLAQTQLSPALTPFATPAIVIGTIALQELEEMTEARPAPYPWSYVAPRTGFYTRPYTPYVTEPFEPVMPVEPSEPIEPTEPVEPTEPTEDGGRRRDEELRLPWLGFPGLGVGRPFWARGYRPSALGIWVSDFAVVGPHPLEARVVRSRLNLTRRYGAVPIGKRGKGVLRSRVVKSRISGNGVRWSGGRQYKGVMAV